MQGVAKMPAGTTGEIARKAVVAGAISGLAIAAAHGDNKDVKKGFLDGAGMIIIQAGYKNFTNQQLGSQTPTRDGYCMLSAGESCSPKEYVQVKNAKGDIIYADPTKFRPNDPVANYVGVQAAADTSGWKFWVSERSPAMNALGRLPPWNDMGLGHDKLVVTIQETGAPNALVQAASVATIAPAVVITYAGVGTSVYTDIQNAVVASASSPAQSTTAAQTSNSKPPAASRSYTVATCVRPEDAKVITKVTVDFPDKRTSPYICEVTLEASQGLSHPWHAEHDASYCASRAVGLTAQLARSGWACLKP
jgi:hypothetical protein